MSDNAKEAYRIIDEYKPAFSSKEEYFEFVNNLSGEGDRIDYSNEKSISVKI